MPVTTGIQYYWLNTELVLLLPLKNQGDRLIQEPAATSFKGIGRPMRRWRPVDKTLQSRAGVTPESLETRKFLPHRTRAFQRSGGPSTAQRNGLWRPQVRPWGLRAVSHRSACERSSSARVTPGSRPAGTAWEGKGPPRGRPDHLLPCRAWNSNTMIASEHTRG